MGSPTLLLKLVIGSAVIVSATIAPFTIVISAAIEAIFASSAPLIPTVRQVGAF